MSNAKPSYYGPFFWVATVSFIVPLVVAAKAINTVPLTTTPASHPDASGVDHALWDQLLKTHVASGLVDYDGLARDHLFRVYLRQLSEAEPENLTTSADELALLCNAYNAYVMHGVIMHGIRDSVMSFQHDGKEFFDVEEHIFCGQTMSLNHIEHELIRKRFKEPRVHVALVCAAKSCPAIRAEAFVGKRLAVQLEDQSVQFANSVKYVEFDSADNTLRLSPLLNWYGGDWDHSGGYLPWLAERVKDPALKEAIEQAASEQVQVAFFDYDWALNSQAPADTTAVAAPKKQAEFGSGSVPNE
ncbi:MAG: DUF547 domain-containing protein [Candidatus Paceibacterota bacterium]